MENRDEKRFADFFGQNKVEIRDDGFSERVMRNLPSHKRNTDWIVPVFTLLGMAIAFLLIDIREVITRILVVLETIPYYYLIGTFMLCPIVFAIVYFFWNKENIWE